MRKAFEVLKIFLLGLHEDCKDNIISVTRDWVDFNKEEDEDGVFQDENQTEMKALRHLVETKLPQENRFTFR